MLNFTKSTLQKEGTLQFGNVTYSVNVTALNSELTRLYCGISKTTVEHQSDVNGNPSPLEQTIQIGHIALEYGRQVTEIAQGEDIIPHLSKFAEILNEVLGKTLSEPKTKK